MWAISFMTYIRTKVDTIVSTLEEKTTAWYVQLTCKNEGQESLICLVQVHLLHALQYNTKGRGREEQNIPLGKTREIFIEEGTLELCS